jgi:prevent-host-death family protein
LLDTAQRTPVTIEKNGRAVAVLISDTEYEAYQKLKLQALQNDLMEGIKQADQGQFLDSETVFHDLI